MVADTARVAHAGGGDDDFRGPVLVQGSGFLRGVGEGEARESEQIFAPLEDGNGLVVQIALQIAGVDFRGLRGQGTVHTDGEIGDGLD